MCVLLRICLWISLCWSRPSELHTFNHHSNHVIVGEERNSYLMTVHFSPCVYHEFRHNNWSWQICLFPGKWLPWLSTGCQATSHPLPPANKQNKSQCSFKMYNSIHQNSILLSVFDISVIEGFSLMLGLRQISPVGPQAKRSVWVYSKLVVAVGLSGSDMLLFGKLCFIKDANKTTWYIQ